MADALDPVLAAVAEPARPGRAGAAVHAAPNRQLLDGSRHRVSALERREVSATVEQGDRDVGEQPLHGWTRHVAHLAPVCRAPYEFPRQPDGQR